MNPATPLPQLLTAREASEYLGVHVETMYSLLNSGEIPGRKVGNRWFVNVAKLAERLTPSDEVAA